MVRNVASMQSLNEHHTSSTPVVQLFGNDDYTKALMQKMAAGEANEEERIAFTQHVNKTRSGRSIPVEALLSVSNDDTANHEATVRPQQLASSLLHDYDAHFQQRQQQAAQNPAVRAQQMQMIRARQRQMLATLQQGRAGPDSATPPSISRLMDQVQIEPRKLDEKDPRPDSISQTAQLDNEMPLQKQRNLSSQQEQLPQESTEMQVASHDQEKHVNEEIQQQQQQQQQLAAKSAARHQLHDEISQLLEGQGLATLKRIMHELKLYQDPQFGYTDLQTRLRNSARRVTPTMDSAVLADQDRYTPQATRENAERYAVPFCTFLHHNPTVFHAVDHIKWELERHQFKELSERQPWDIKPGGEYFVERNGSSLIAFIVGKQYKPGNGAAILAGHVDALTAKLKPISQVPNKAGYLQLGVAPYAGALNSTWWDRDLGIGGRVHIREGGKIVTKLVKLDWPIAKIPTLAPHFGAAAAGPFDKETQMVPIVGLDTEEDAVKVTQSSDGFSMPPLHYGTRGGASSFVHTQPPALVRAIGKELGLNTSNYSDIVNWELELFDIQPPAFVGLNKEFISAGRIDDKLCSWAAVQALTQASIDTKNSGIIKVVGLFDDEEIGSQLRQGAKGNFLASTMERAVGSLADHQPDSDLMGRTYANSFMVSSDVTHAVNPNFLGAYLENHAPHLNVGLAIAADANGHMTTDSVSTTILSRCAEKIGANLQVFQIRNGTPSGGTVGPMLSSALGVRAIDAGLAQLSMHSIRATTGTLDPGLGAITFLAFLNNFEAVDKEVQDKVISEDL